LICWAITFATAFSQSLLLVLPVVLGCSKQSEGMVPNLKIDGQVLQSKEPATIGEAAGLLLQAMDSDSRVAFAGVDRRDLILYHRGLGMLIRNEFRMWGTNTNLANSFIKTHSVARYPKDDPHPDNVSVAIIVHAWEQAQVFRK
jgi:hypothetical protein